jgi:hypothetical protein
MPQFFLLENVPAIKDNKKQEKGSKKKAIDNNAVHILQKSLSLGYWVQIFHAAAENFGLPQRRPRIIFVGERRYPSGTTMIPKLFELVRSMFVSTVFPLVKVIGLKRPHLPGFVQRRKGTVGKNSFKWVAEHKKLFKKYKFVFKQKVGPVDIPVGMDINDTFWTLQDRHKSAAVFIYQFLQTEAARLEYGISSDTLCLSDLNCSLGWNMRALGIDELPCVTTKSIMSTICPSFSVITDDRVLFDLQGLDASAWPNIAAVAHSDRLAITGEAFIMPMVGYLFYGILSLSDRLYFSRAEADAAARSRS